MKPIGGLFFMLKNTIENIKDRVRLTNKGVEILSTEYDYKSRKVECKCLIDGRRWSADIYNLMKGCGCPECKSRKMGDSRRGKIEDVYSEFTERGYIPIFKSYKNSQQRLEAKTQEGYIISISRSHLKEGKVPTIFGNDNPHTVENIKNYIKINNINYTLISLIYKNAQKDKLKWVCEKGHCFNMPWNSIQQGRRCPICFGNHKKTNEQFILEINEAGKSEYILLSEYVNDAKHVKLKHIKCGYEYSVTPSHFLQGKRCPKCAIRRGERNNKYNPLLTAEDRIKRRLLDGQAQSKWRNIIFERDKYTCQRCNKKTGYLNAHHLNGYHWYKEGRFDPFNGITLCRECHREFHKACGTKNNTKEQYLEYSKATSSI